MNRAPLDPSVAVWMSGVAGALVGPVLLTWLAFTDHVARTGSESEFWGEFVTIPLGIVAGAVVGTLLARLAFSARADRFLPRGGPARLALLSFEFVALTGLFWLVIRSMFHW